MKNIRRHPIFPLITKGKQAQHDDRKSKSNIMTGRENNVINRVEQKAKILMKEGVKTKNERSTANGYPLPLMPKGEKRKA